MSKHTPGPWFVKNNYNRFSVTRDEKRIFIIANLSPGIGEENLSNARLIAAAPKMYELLDKLRNVIIETSENGNSANGLMTVWNTLANDGIDLLDEIEGKEDSHE